MLEQLFGSLALIMGIATFLVGLAHIAWINFRAKEWRFSIVFTGLGTITCVVRIIYFVLSEAWWTISPDVIGIILGIILFIQYGAYKRHWWGTTQPSNN